MSTDIFDAVLGRQLTEEEMFLPLIPDPSLNPIPIPEYLLYPDKKTLRMMQILEKSENSRLLKSRIIHALTFGDQIMTAYVALLTTAQILKNRKELVRKTNSQIEMFRELYRVNRNRVEGELEMIITKRRANEMVIESYHKMTYELAVSELELRQIKYALDEMAMEACHDVGRILNELCVQFDEFFEKEKIE